MRKRLLKYLRRFLIFIVLLGIIGLVAFTWICYWPLEGGVTDLDQLIPSTAEFVVRGDYEALKETDWVQKNLLEDPLHGSLREFVRGTGRDRRAPNWPRAKRELQALSTRINDQIPLGVVEFDLERDVLAGEVVIAGAWCQGTQPPSGPQWQEILLLKRLSWKSRAGLSAALGNQWIRDMAIPGGQLEFENFEDEIYRLRVPGIPVRPELERSGCGRGYVMPPDNEWYVTRIKDVVAISNSPGMIREVAHLSELKDDHGEGFRGRDWFDFASDGARVVASVDVDPLHEYLTLALEEGLGDRRKFLQHYALTDSFERLNGRVDLDATDQILGTSQIMLKRGGLNDELRHLYGLPQTPLAEGISLFVPAESTWLTATVRAPPMHFFKSVLSMLTDSERALLDDNVRGTRDAGGEQFTGIEDLLGQLTPRLGDTAWIAVGRLDEVFNRMEYSEWYPGKDEFDPYPAFAFMMRLREGASLAEVDEFLQGKAAAMGFKKEFERKTHAGIAYTRLHMIEQTADYKYVQPCYYLAQDRFIFCNNEAWFHKVLETIADPKLSLARSEKFRVAMGKVASKGHVGLYVDLERLLAVPARAGRGGQPRGHLWDLRQQVVTDPLKDRKKAQAKLSALVRAFTARHSRQPRDQEMEKLFDQRDAFMTSWRRGYPKLIEEYRRSLDDLSRLRALALSIGALDDELDARLLITLKPSTGR